MVCRGKGIKSHLLVQEVEARSLLCQSGISTVDYVINPYVGCEYGCIYCYAVFMKRFTGHKEEWGTFVDVKVNAPQLLAKELRRAKPGKILLSSVTDPYQPLERRYRLTRRCLEVLQEYPDFEVSILTKSALVLRDLDLLRGLRQVEVAFTITGLNEGLRRIFEPRASPFRARIEALARLSTVGIEVWAFFGPVLPFLTDSQEAIEILFKELRGAEVKRVLVDRLNLKGAVWGRLKKALKAHYLPLVDDYRLLAGDMEGYSYALGERMRQAAAKYGLEWESCF